MPILDLLNRNESEYFAKVFKLEIDYFSRDLNLLLNSKASVLQPSYDYLPPAKIKEILQKGFLKMESTWEGDIQGVSNIFIKETDAKIMAGLLMMMGAEEIKEALSQPFSDDDLEIFKEICNQINGSLDNALREKFTFNFHTTLTGVEHIVFNKETEGRFKEIFNGEGYMAINAILKLTGFPDSTMSQYIPKEIIQTISKLEGLEHGGDKEKKQEEKDRNVLIVDDDPVVRKIIKGFLKDQNLGIFDAEDGVAAMQLLIRNEVSLIILDIEMPNMDGLETCKRIKQNPKTRNIPIVMCSSKSTRDNVLAAVNSGARDFIVKPINNKQEFQNRVLKYINS